MARITAAKILNLQKRDGVHISVKVFGVFEIRDGTLLDLKFMKSRTYTHTSSTVHGTPWSSSPWA